MLTTQISVRYELDQLDYTVYRVSPCCFSISRRKTCRKVLEICFLGIPGYFRSDGSLHTVYSMILLRGEKKMNFEGLELIMPVKLAEYNELKDRVRELEEKIRVLEIQNENKNVGKRLSLYETIHKKCEYL